MALVEPSVGLACLRETRLRAERKAGELGWRNEDGRAAIDYGLIAILTAVAAVAVMYAVGTNLVDLLSGSGVRFSGLLEGRAVV
jgi:Flp pilus assembly pilin Flp